MVKLRYRQYANIFSSQPRSKLAIYSYNSTTRDGQPNHHRKNHRSNVNNGYNFNIQPIKYLLVLLLSANASFPKASNANDVGGVSATANPIANSSGSVTNQAIQVLQGPYITNTYGNGVQCQGPTLNITPFLTGLTSWKVPYEEYYNDPVYDTSVNEEGNLNNPGGILYNVPIRTGQKANNNVNLGISATVSIPLDRRLHKGCIRAAETETAIRQQILASKRLDFEMARLKHCGIQAKEGVTFAKNSPYASICADIRIENVGVLRDHTHSISSPKPVEVPLQSDSSPSEKVDAPENSKPSPSSLESSQSSSKESSQQALSLSEQDQPAVLLGLPMSLPQPQWKW